MKSIARVLLLALAISACSVEKDDFIPLSSVPISYPGSDTLLVKNPREVMMKDSLLFLLASGPDEFVNVFSYPEMRLVCKLGAIGRGSGELIGVSTFDVDDDFLYLFDIPTSRRFRYSLSDVSRGEKKPDEIRKFDAFASPVLSFARCAGGMVAVEPKSPRVVLVSDDGTVSHSDYGLPDMAESVAERLNPMYVPSLWSGSVDCSDDGRILAAVTLLGDVLEIISLPDFERKLVVGEGGLPDVVTSGKAVSMGKIDGYFDVHVSGERIFALFSGMDREEMSRRLAAGESVPAGANIVKEFDLEGNLLRRYLLDRHITSFCMSEDGKSIIALAAEYEHLFYKFKL